MGIPDRFICLLRNYMQVKKQRLELDMEQQTGSKSGKENVKAVYCHPAYLTFMQSTSGEMLGWMKDKLKSRFQGTISITQICRWHQPYSRKWRRTKEPLDESERGEWKSWPKAQHSENEDHGIRSHHFMGNGETVETVSYFIFLGGSKIISLLWFKEIKFLIFL